MSCIHHWCIESASHGGEYHGHCRNCDATGAWPNEPTFEYGHGLVATGRSDPDYDERLRIALECIAGRRFVPREGKV